MRQANMEAFGSHEPQRIAAIFHATIRKSCGSFEAVIPDDVVEHLGLIEGQVVAIQVTPIEPERAIREEITNILDKTAERSAPVMRYMKDK